MSKSIDLKYSVGEEVHFTDGYSYTFEVECTRCSHTGTVTLADGTTMPCGVCNGRKTLHRRRPYKLRPGKGKVHKIDITSDKDKTEIRYYVDTVHFGLAETEVYTSFYAARKVAHTLNIKYGWPKKDFDRWETGGPMAHLAYPDRTFWGRKVRKSNKKT